MIPFKGLSSITLSANAGENPDEFTISRISDDPVSGQGVSLSAPFKFGLQFLSKNCDKTLKQATVTILYGDNDSLTYTFHVKCTAKTCGVENMTEPGEYYWIVPEYAGLPAFNAAITVVAGGGDGCNGIDYTSQYVNIHSGGGGGGAGERKIIPNVLLCKGKECRMTIGDSGQNSSMQYLVPINPYLFNPSTVSCTAGTTTTGFPTGNAGIQKEKAGMAAIMAEVSELVDLLVMEAMLLQTPAAGVEAVTRIMRAAKAEAGSSVSNGAPSRSRDLKKGASRSLRSRGAVTILLKTAS